MKSNVGHLEGASGIAGLIKTVLALEKGVIPPTTNFERLNPEIDAEYLNIAFPLRPTLWPGNGIRRASVNSFGFGGSNSHIVIDDAYHYLRLRNLSASHCSVEKPPSHEDLKLGAGLQPAVAQRSLTSRVAKTKAGSKLFVWSAADAGGLSRIATTFSQHTPQIPMKSEDEVTYLEALAYTLNLRRSSLPWKSFVVSDSVSKFIDLTTCMSTPVCSVDEFNVGYSFTGQGA